MSPVLWLAIVGLLGIVLGLFALFFVRRAGAIGNHPPSWRTKRIATVLVGLVLSVASFFFTSTATLGYPLTEPSGRIGRVVGIPFIAVYFDPGGSDYVGLITFVSLGANSLFWFLVPYIVLAVSVVLWRRSLRQANAPTLGSQALPPN